MTIEELGILFNIKPQAKVDNIVGDITDIKLYHKDIGLPKNIYIQEKFIRLKYTPHALKEASSDRYGEIKLPSSITIKRSEVIEVETINNKLNKLVLRITYNETHDLIIVILIKGNKVKTVWLNSKDDIHQTLDESKYEST